jgi:arsenite/tail-anchored protein-transporting ATPase
VRTLLVTGPGGAGSSTLSAAAAVRAARAGRRTVLLSLRPPVVAGLDAVPGLTVTTVDAQAGIERFWAAHADALAAVLPQLDLPPATSVAAVPGTAELALLAELGRADADVLVLDAGPLEAALSLVGLPPALHAWIDQLLPARLRALAAFSGALGGAGAALAAVPALERLLDGSPLADPSSVDVVLAAQARRGTATELRTAITALGLHGLRPAAVLARVLPEGEGAWWAARAVEQDAELAALAELAPVTAVAEAAVLPGDVDGLDGLLGDDELPRSEAPVRPAPRRTDAGWDLAVALPFAERGDVELTRFGDLLVLTAAGARRALRLDALLRRCTVTGGRLDAPGTAGTRLVVSFEPDPAVWPADLLAAHGAAR